MNDLPIRDQWSLIAAVCLLVGAAIYSKLSSKQNADEEQAKEKSWTSSAFPVMVIVIFLALSVYYRTVYN